MIPIPGGDQRLDCDWLVARSAAIGVCCAFDMQFKR
jgi:hypothetical protein